MHENQCTLWTFSLRCIITADEEKNKIKQNKVKQNQEFDRFESKI